MATEVNTLTISVLTRHSEDCPQINPQYKRCKCRKSVYNYEGGKVRWKSAKTHSWEQPERVEQDERDKRGPVKLRLREIEVAEAVKAEALKAGEVLLPDALKLLIENQKGISIGSLKPYESCARKLSRWADGKGLKYLSEIKPSMLAEWRA
jgi:hypothetical protein